MGALMLSLIVLGAPAMATTLGVDGTHFTVDGKPTFLFGCSYYAALGASDEVIAQDLDEMQRHRFNWIRVWATWASFENNVGVFDERGNGREPQMGKLRALVAECDRRGMVVDVTLSRGNGVSGTPRLQALEEHKNAVQALCRELKPWRNWYLDLANERNIKDKRYCSIEELAELRVLARERSPDLLVTASHAGDISREELVRYLKEVRVDFISPHRPRGKGTAQQTRERTRQYLAEMEQLGRAVPVHYQEPFRRGFGSWDPSAEDFVVDLVGARVGGAAGWCFHNGDQRSAGDGRPRRSFDLREGRLFSHLDAEEVRAIAGFDQVPEVTYVPLTRVNIRDGRWEINGKVTYPGAAAEGLLMNVRMVNSVFEDRGSSPSPNLRLMDGRPFDPEANTSAFLAQIGDYAAHGVRAFTVFLQGGFPGYEGAVNSAFDPDGSLRPEYLARVRRVIEACDRQGLVVILGCFYQRQDQILQDDEAVRRGTVETAKWVENCGFTNVVLDIANEHDIRGFDHEFIRTGPGIASLVTRAKEAVPWLLVSSSGAGHGRCKPELAQAADFLLIHFNGTPVAEIPARVEALKAYGKPIVCNEDDKVGEEGAAAAEASVRSGASWGFMHSRQNQYVPFRFEGAADDPVVYRKLKELTSPAGG